MTEHRQGIILSCVGGRYTVLSDHVRYSCYAKGSFRHAGIKPLPGDCVTFVPGASFPDDGTPLPPSKENDGYLLQISERKSLLRRPPIANVDTLLIFATAADPEPDTLYLDRLTVCALHAGIRPVILCNKSDLAPDTASELVEIYRTAGFEAHAISAGTNAGLDTEVLTDLLRGRTTAMAGFSGVGKTTFFNLLFPNECGEVGELSKKLGRGKNTTRTTQLHSLKRSVLKIDGLFADTAGFSRLELEGSQSPTAEELVFLFPEFEDLLGTCRFTKCSHQSELGCAIREAVENGAIPSSRYESFCDLLNEAKKK